jgi:hypothetical protein
MILMSPMSPSGGICRSGRTHAPTWLPVFLDNLFPMALTSFSRDLLQCFLWKMASRSVQSNGYGARGPAMTAHAGVRITTLQLA